LIPFNKKYPFFWNFFAIHYGQANTLAIHIQIVMSASRGDFQALKYKKLKCIADDDFDCIHVGFAWTNYMNRVLELKETGSWVKEVISAEPKTATNH
jgi:hypothetical protein